MEAADKVLTAITVGQKGSDAVPLLEEIRATLNKAVDETDAAESGEANLAARLAAMLATIASSYVALAGLTADLNAAGFKITGSADAVADTDLTTLQQVNALIQGGGSPGDIAITALGGGSLSASQLLRRNATNNGFVGLDYLITTLGIAGATAGQQPYVNIAGNAFEMRDPDVNAALIYFMGVQ